GPYFYKEEHMIRVYILLIIIFICTFLLTLTPLFAQEQDSYPGTAVYFELIGKGWFSPNIDFRIKDNHRFSIGLTLLEYEVGENGNETKDYFSPSIMYYLITGDGPSYFEVGAGASATSRWNEDYNESRISLHGGIGYRHQKKDGFLYRVGFTPFYRVNGVFFPLFGLSFGYSW
ncbi:MAG: hypothetical protein JXB48_16135, partial [Candidatus Latescibacteria bacterium]|nr:hypothetical protein [Candidatus Latescibacterota bacterium]